ncbi:Gldg family protein [Chitinophaga sp. YIM B06452]|uniref:Gldg family protein n=1 Tax=Chitinophaga sp. YIM B06452 TaxID=3082158 RepID=UPI0031FF3E15
MSIILKIAKNELRNLFYSPIAWFLAFIFMIMCAYFYTSTIYEWSKMGSFFTNRPHMEYWVVESTTEGIYWRPGSFFSAILSNVYLFIPLLTMGIISREFNSGAVRLLYSSPVKLSSIVWGKYLAIIIYSLVLIAIIGIFIAIGFFNLRALDYGPLLSAMLGFFLLMCALTAIGVFMSSLTQYQIVSAISCFALLFVLNIIGSIWQQYDLIRDLTYFAAITGRAEKMLTGLITSKDILYFLIITGIFISFTIIRLHAGRSSRPWYKTTGLCLAVAMAGILLGYAGSRPGWVAYFDTTARESHTIHPRTRAILAKTAGAPLEVTLYVNLLGARANAGFPRMRNAYLTGLWEQYQRFKPDIRFTYEYYYDVPDGDTFWYEKFPGKSLQQIAGLVAKISQVDSALFRPPGEMRKLIDLHAEDYALVVQLKYKGRTTLLRTYDDPILWPNEQNINAALQRLLEAHIPKVYFVTGQLERNAYKGGEREYAILTTLGASRGSLINTGFDVDTLNLQEQDVPADADLLVLADPKIAFSAPVLEKLRQYTGRGGNMFILGEPGKQAVVNPVLKSMGVALMNGQLVQPTYDETPDKVGVYFTLPSFRLAEEFFLSLYGRMWSNRVYNDSLTTVLPGATGLAYSADSGFTVKPLLMTLPGLAWSKAGKLVTDSVAPTFDPGEGDVKLAAFPAAVQLIRQRGNKEQRIIVSSDADIASNFRLSKHYAHPEWILGIYSWLCYNEFPVYTPAPVPKDNRLLTSVGNARIQRTLFCWVFPGLLLLSGSILLVRRQRK